MSHMATKPSSDFTKLDGVGLNLKKAEAYLQYLAETRLERTLATTSIDKRVVIPQNEIPPYPTMPTRAVDSSAPLLLSQTGAHASQRAAPVVSFQSGPNAEQPQKQEEDEEDEEGNGSARLPSAGAHWAAQPTDGKLTTIQRLRGSLMSSLASYDWRRDAVLDLPIACAEYYSDLSQGRLQRLQAQVTQEYIARAEALLVKYAQDEAASNSAAVFSAHVNAQRASVRLLSDMHRKHSTLRLGTILAQQVRAMMQRDGVLPPGMQLRLRREATASKVDSGLHRTTKGGEQEEEPTEQGQAALDSARTHTQDMDSAVGLALQALTARRRSVDVRATAVSVVKAANNPGLDAVATLAAENNTQAFWAARGGPRLAGEGNAGLDIPLLKALYGAERGYAPTAGQLQTVLEHVFLGNELRLFDPAIEAAAVVQRTAALQGRSEYGVSARGASSALALSPYATACSTLPVPVPGQYAAGTGTGALVTTARGKGRTLHGLLNLDGHTSSTVLLQDSLCTPGPSGGGLDHVLYLGGSASRAASGSTAVATGGPDGLYGLSSTVLSMLPGALPSSTTTAAAAAGAETDAGVQDGGGAGSHTGAGRRGAGGPVREGLASIAWAASAAATQSHAEAQAGAGHGDGPPASLAGASALVNVAAQLALSRTERAQREREEHEWRAQHKAAVARKVAALPLGLGRATVLSHTHHSTRGESQHSLPLAQGSLLSSSFSQSTASIAGLDRDAPAFVTALSRGQEVESVEERGGSSGVVPALNGAVHEEELVEESRRHAALLASVLPSNEMLESRLLAALEQAVQAQAQDPSSAAAARPQQRKKREAKAGTGAPASLLEGGSSNTGLLTSSLLSSGALSRRQARQARHEGPPPEFPLIQRIPAAMLSSLRAHTTGPTAQQPGVRGDQHPSLTSSSLLSLQYDEYVEGEGRGDTADGKEEEAGGMRQGGLTVHLPADTLQVLQAGTVSEDARVPGLVSAILPCAVSSAPAQTGSAAGGSLGAGSVTVHISSQPTPTGTAGAAGAQNALEGQVSGLESDGGTLLRPLPSDSVGHAAERLKGGSVFNLAWTPTLPLHPSATGRQGQGSEQQEGHGSGSGTHRKRHSLHVVGNLAVAAVSLAAPSAHGHGSGPARVIIEGGDYSSHAVLSYKPGMAALQAQASALGQAQAEAEAAELAALAAAMLGAGGQEEAPGSSRSMATTATMATATQRRNSTTGAGGVPLARRLRGHGHGQGQGQGSAYGSVTTPKLLLPAPMYRHTQVAKAVIAAATPGVAVDTTDPLARKKAQAHAEAAPGGAGGWRAGRPVTPESPDLYTGRAPRAAPPSTHADASSTDSRWWRRQGYIPAATALAASALLSPPPKHSSPAGAATAPAAAHAQAAGLQEEHAQHVMPLPQVGVILSPHTYGRRTAEWETTPPASSAPSPHPAAHVGGTAAAATTPLGAFSARRLSTILDAHTGMAQTRSTAHGAPASDARGGSEAAAGAPGQDRERERERGAAPPTYRPPVTPSDCSVATVLGPGRAAQLAMRQGIHDQADLRVHVTTAQRAASAWGARPPPVEATATAEGEGVLDGVTDEQAAAAVRAADTQSRAWEYLPSASAAHVRAIARARVTAHERRLGRTTDLPPWQRVKQENEEVKEQLVTRGWDPKVMSSLASLSHAVRESAGMPVRNSTRAQLMGPSASLRLLPVALSPVRVHSPMPMDRRSTAVRSYVKGRIEAEGVGRKARAAARAQLQAAEDGAARARSPDSQQRTRRRKMSATEEVIDRFGGLDSPKRIAGSAFHKV